MNIIAQQAILIKCIHNQTIQVYIKFIELTFRYYIATSSELCNDEIYKVHLYIHDYLTNGYYKNSNVKRERVRRELGKHIMSKVRMKSLVIAGISINQVKFEWE